MTFCHHVEETHRVPYRLEKWFEDDRTGADGVTSRRRFSIYLRNLDAGVETQVEPMDSLLWAKGLYHNCRYEREHGFRTMRAQHVFKETSCVTEAAKTEGTLYRIRKEGST
jgi:aminoglycoside 3-N-acetyltransferase